MPVRDRAELVRGAHHIDHGWRPDRGSRPAPEPSDCVRQKITPAHPSRGYEGGSPQWRWKRNHAWFKHTGRAPATMVADPSERV